MSNQPLGPDTRYCRQHSEAPTNLKCSRCGDYICVRCIVHSPVGARCPRCSKIRKIPTYDVTKLYLLRGISTSVLMGILSGSLLVFLGPILINRIAFLDTFAILALGYMVGESVSISVNRKRGQVLRYVAIIGVVIMYAIIVLFGGWTITLWDMLAGGMGIYLAITKL